LCYILVNLSILFVESHGLKMKGSKKGTVVSKDTFSKLIQALKKSFGVRTKACGIVGVEISVFNHMYRSDPLFRHQVDCIEDFCLDFVESKLFEKIEEGNLQAITFYLRCRGKKRGYIEKTEVDINNNINVEVTDKLENFDERLLRDIANGKRSIDSLVGPAARLGRDGAETPN
jgi:hypothetical protein